MFVPQEIVYTRNVPSCRKLSTMELSKRSCVNLSSLWLPSITVVGKHRAFEFDTSTFNNFLVIELLFFAAYVICKENYSLSSVVFLFFSFFFRPKLPTFFIQKQMTAVGLGLQGSQAVSSWFESLSCQIFLRFDQNIF